MKKLFLTSAIIGMFALPTYATTVTGSGSECNENTLNTDTGPATLQAQWNANTINLNWYSDDSQITVPTASNTCTYDGGITLPTTNPTKEGYTFGGWQVRQTLDLMALIGTGSGTSYAYINNSGSFSENYAAHGQSYYGINGNNTWALDYGSSKGMLIGAGRCSTQPGSNGWYTNGNYDDNGDWSNITKLSSLTDETGQTGAQYCYCGVTGYKDTNGNMQSLSSAWVFTYDIGGASGCADYCAYNCALSMGFDDSNHLAFRAAVLGSVQ